jgi:two-component system, LytTR family, sensor histidine kinase AlgZ
MSRIPTRKPPARPRYAGPAAAGRAAQAGAGPQRHHDPLDTDLGSVDTRPTSLWPASTRPAELSSSGFEATHFDPLLEDKARDGTRARAALDVCTGTLALRAVLSVQVVLAIGVLLSAGGTGDWLARQAAAMFVGVGATVLWLVAVCALKEPLSRRPARGRVLGLLALGAAAALLAWWPLWWAGLVDAAGGLHVPGVMLAGAALAGALWVWLEQRARLWQPVDASVRLAELQSRIRPHFLFNALNTALALVRVDPARAEGVLEDLAQLFRVALADAGTSVSLDEEIDLAQRYLAIEQIRYGKRLQVNWDIDARVGRARVPPLVLQPLVENAVRHGVEPSVQGARLWVQAGVRRGQAVILVSNTVPETPSTPGHGMALHNVRERLRLLHDVAGQCDVWREGELFRARIIVPM